MSDKIQDIITVVVGILIMGAFATAIFAPLYTIGSGQQAHKVNMVEYVSHNIRTHNSNENRTV